jgi:hypothetical protein
MHRQNSEPEPERQSELQVETDLEDQDDDPLEIAALEAEVDVLLQGVQVDETLELEFGLDLDSEVPLPGPVPVPASNDVGTASDTGTTSGWYHGKYPLHRKSPLCFEIDRKRKEQDIERQMRDKHLLDKWPRVSIAEKEKLLQDGECLIVVVTIIIPGPRLLEFPY